MNDLLNNMITTQSPSTPTAKESAAIISNLQNQVEELEQKVAILEQKRRGKGRKSLRQQEQLSREWCAYLSGTRKEPPAGEDPLSPEEKEQIRREMNEIARPDHVPPQFTEIAEKFQAKLKADEEYRIRRDEQQQSSREWSAYLKGTRNEPPEGEEPMTPEERKKFCEEMNEINKFDHVPKFPLLIDEGKDGHD